ncbi:MAG: exodeoxyribonuclease VII small subunit [Fusobacteriaceae bacterium]|jgi:exodeoxyribonuclease VII small subunit|nr:exodeoxyribonuclease VII small subunit [Fusobacteriaceae bacterium]
MKKNTFEENLNSIDEIIEKLENGQLNLDDSIKEYESAMKLLKESSEMLKEAEGKILKVGNSDIEEIK